MLASGGSGGAGNIAVIDSGLEHDATLDAVVELDADVDAAVAPSWPKPCAPLYAPDTVPTFALTFTDAEWLGVQADCAARVQQYRPVQLTHDGNSVSAMARLKGNWTWNCDKLQLVVSFNEVNKDGRYQGLRKLVFDAPWYDRTLLHERLAFWFFETRGLPYSCVNNARLEINGAYYGAYVNVERLDKEYLQRHFEEDEGNLYQGGVELKTNETLNDQTDIEALRAATTPAEIDALMDLDQAVAEWATEAMLPALDNYWAGVEINYYIYNHPTRGFVYLPYDMDIVFGDAAYDDGALLWPDAAQADPLTYEHWEWKKEDLVKIVLSDPTWCAQFVDELVLARAAYSPETMSALVDDWGALIEQAVTDDPHKPFTLAEHQAALVDLNAFFATRAAFVDTWLATEHCPASF
jgi:CotH kinase protein